MYSIRSGLILGFHSCDKKIRDSVLKGSDKLKKSNNEYDWLGHGIYFWENSLERAEEHAEELLKSPHKTKGKINNPTVLGAVLSLGNCLDLLDSKSIEVVRNAYETLIETSSVIPENKKPKGGKNILIRNLDCAVIEMVHSINESLGERRYDSVRGMFEEGDELYPNSGFKTKNHIQICIRNPNCIKGYFLPVVSDKNYEIP
ncbi:MAG: hypothetical protein K1X86_04270 [Ignavibacteria bacterium]|nr:hypothetical protein [Ignavibacteria bacterium]